MKYNCDTFAELALENQALKAENQKLLNQLVYIHELSPVERRTASETALREKIEEMQNQRMKYEIDSAEERGEKTGWLAAGGTISAYHDWNFDRRSKNREAK